MLGAAETPYDLRFSLLGIPVRIHPLFWAVTAVLGFRMNERNLPMVVVWVACVFVSILVHEYGHALMARNFGQLAFDCAVGHGRALLQPGRAADALAAVGGRLERSRGRARAIRPRDAHCLQLRLASRRMKTGA